MKSESIYTGEQMQMSLDQTIPSYVTSSTLLDFVMNQDDEIEEQLATKKRRRARCRSELIDNKKQVVVSNTFVVGIEQGSSFAYKLSRVAIAQIPMDAKELPLTVITSDDIAAMGYTRQRLTGHMSEVIDEILNYRVKLTQLDKLHNKSVRLTGINVFAQASIIPRRGAIIVQLNPILKEHFLALRADFTSYALSSVLKLPGLATPKLHDLLVSRAKKYNNNLFRFKVEDLIVILDYQSGPNAVPSSFITNVIKRAVKAINKYSELQVEWQTVKTGRICTDVRFYIRHEWFSLEEKQAAIQWEEAQISSGSHTGKQILKERERVARMLESGKGEIYLYASNNYNTTNKGSQKPVPPYFSIAAED